MPASSDVAFAGQRLRRKVLLALALSAVVPLLILAYVTHGYVLPGLDPTDTTRFYALQLLMLFTMLAMVSGGYIIWDLGRTIARLAEMFGDDGRMAKLEHRKDEVGTLMQSFAKMLETIEQQAAEINSFASRLDQAYKELESSKAGARLYADRIRQVVSTYPFSHGKRITASFGIASLPDEEAQTSEDLVRAADDALYAAKRAGKNQVATTDSPEKVP